MKVAIYETYIKKGNGSMMHFDIILPAPVKDLELVLSIGQEFLNKKGHHELSLTGEECQFCHYQAPHKDWKKDIEEKGFHIVEFEGCRG